MKRCAISVLRLCDQNTLKNNPADAVCVPDYSPNAFLYHIIYTIRAKAAAGERVY